MLVFEGAIMFGDSLLPSECSLIVEELKQTSLCFQVRYMFSMFVHVLKSSFHDKLSNSICSVHMGDLQLFLWSTWRHCIIK